MKESLIKRQTFKGEKVLLFIIKKKNRFSGRKKNPAYCHFFFSSNERRKERIILNHFITCEEHKEIFLGRKDPCKGGKKLFRSLSS